MTIKFMDELSAVYPISKQEECRVAGQLVNLSTVCVNLRENGHRELQRLRRSFGQAGEGW